MANDFKKTLSNLPATLKGSKGPLLIAGGIIILGGAYSLTQHSHVAPNKSTVGNVPTINRHIGAPVSQDYAQQISKYDDARKQAAVKNNDSFIPSMTIGDESANTLPTHLDTNDEEGADSATPPKIPPVTTPHIVDTAPPAAQKPVAVKKPVKPVRYVSASRIDELEKQLASHMNTDSFAPQVVYSNRSVSSVIQTASNQEESRWNGGTKASLQAASANTGASTTPSFDIPTAGTILQGHFISLVDSRVPGVVLGVIDSGPYKNSRVLGRFQTSSNNQLMVSFSNLVVTYRDDEGELRSKALNINAVAVDPTTLSQGMADYVNQHMLAKISTTLATSFMQGIGQAIQMSGSTASYSASGGTFVSQGQKNLQQQLLQAGGQSASQMSSLLSQYFGNMPTTIKIYQYRNFGLLFVGQQ